MSGPVGGSDRRGRYRNGLSIFLKGVAMGAADAIPGVSGGTIALITGIYERLIDAIAGVSEYGPELVEDLTGGDNPGRLHAVAGTLRAMDVPFLMVLGLGVVTGGVTLANLAHVALERFPAATFAFFFGIILASPVVLRDQVSLREPRPLAAGVVGALLAFAVGGLPSLRSEYTLPVLFLIGALVVCATVLPGISGSLVLVLIGAYDTMTRAVSALTGAAFDGSVADAVGPLATLVVFAAGALVGLLTFARVVSWAIDTYRVPTMTFLVGVMLGALRAPARQIAESVDRFSADVVVVLVVAGVVGALVVLVLEYVTEDI